MSAGVVELTTANAEVASLTIGGAWLALTVISAHVRRAAAEIGIALSAQAFTCLSIALALQSHVREIAATTVLTDHSISTAFIIASTSIAISNTEDKSGKGKLREHDLFFINNN